VTLLPFLFGACLLVGAQEPASVSALARRIAKEKDGVDPAVFELLADHGSAAALKALDRGQRTIKDPELTRALFQAVARFASDPELAQSAGSLLEDKVRKGKSETTRLAAARAILAFEPLELAQGWAGRHKDDAVRALFADALVVARAESGDPERIRAVFDSTSLSLEAGVRYLGVGSERAARLALEPHREVVRGALAGLRGSEVLCQALVRPDLDRIWKLMLLRLLADDSSPRVSVAVASACADPDPAVALLAVEFLVARVDFEGRAQALEPLLRSKSAALRRAALAGLGQVHKRDGDFRERLLGYATSKDEALRMGAAAALAEVRTPAALDALVAMIPDPSWSVRVEVLHQLLKARPKQAIGVLIERLGLESGRLGSDVHAALVGITALDLGRRPDAWKLWWQREAAGFQVPGAAQASKALAGRKAGRRGGTVATKDFYEIQVESERVVFVLDNSGSMRLPVKTTGTVEKTRMELAKEQLTEVLRSLPDDTLFNVVFFEQTVKALSRKSLEMNKSNRAKALRFVREQYAVGSTALYPALQLAFADPLIDTVYLLSDGAPTEGEITDIEEIRAEVARWNAARHVKIHGVSMGQDSTLLRWLCEDTGGSYKRVD
jgi:von Willebrand factor type A domain/HEAT repeats